MNDNYSDVDVWLMYQALIISIQFHLFSGNFISAMQITTAAVGTLVTNIIALAVPTSLIAGPLMRKPRISPTKIAIVTTEQAFPSTAVDGFVHFFRKSIFAFCKKVHILTE